MNLTKTVTRTFLFDIVEDEAHSDFIALRNMIIRTNLNDLRDVTHNIHYENYRYKKLSSFHASDSKNGKTLQTSLINKYDAKLFTTFSYCNCRFLLEIYYRN